MSPFNTLSMDDLFFIIINFCMMISIILKNIGVFEKIFGKMNKTTKTDIEESNNLITYFMGLIYLIYSIYMIKLIIYNKQYILTSRIVYIFTYIVAGVTIGIAFFNFIFK